MNPTNGFQNFCAENYNSYIILKEYLKHIGNNKLKEPVQLNKETEEQRKFIIDKINNVLLKTFEYQNIIYNYITYTYTEKNIDREFIFNNFTFIEDEIDILFNLILNAKKSLSNINGIYKNAGKEEISKNIKKRLLKPIENLIENNIKLDIYINSLQKEALKKVSTNNKYEINPEEEINKKLDLLNKNGDLSFKDIKNMTLACIRYFHKMQKIEDEIVEYPQMVNKIINTYVDKFCAIYPQIKENPKRLSALQLTAFSIALKVWIDQRTFYLIHYKDYVPSLEKIDFKVLSSMELDFLKTLNWNLNLTASLALRE